MRGRPTDVRIVVNRSLPQKPERCSLPAGRADHAFEPRFRGITGFDSTICVPVGRLNHMLFW